MSSAMYRSSSLRVSAECRFVRIVVASFGRIAEGSAGQQMNVPICVPIRRSMWPPKCGSPGAAIRWLFPHPRIPS